MGLQAASLQGRRILVVEDEYLVGLGLVGILEQAGAQVLGPIGALDEAMAMVENKGQTFDAAVLDVRVNGKESYSVADALAARAVKIVFATGYGSHGMEDKYKHHPRCEKPYNANALVAALTMVMKS